MECAFHLFKSPEKLELNSRNLNELRMKSLIGTFIRAGSDFKFRELPLNYYNGRKHN